ncbi:MAG TPA: hypothetical protein VFA04_08455 [Bryobacteraceae bacterium]|nr:hypothetical protein [Bryobacteraceae bacterium]
MPETAVAFLSSRKLHVRRDGATRVIESEFERSVRERAASIARRNDWKMHGLSAMVTGEAAAGLANARPVPVMLTGLTAGPEHGLLYSMETDAISGVFLLDAEGCETRLFHTADFRIRHVAFDSGSAMVAASAFHKDQARSNIAVLPMRGTDITEVTEGDSFDQLPQWVPGPRRQIVFQSAGIGRDAAGRIAGIAPSTIQRLDLDSGDLEEIASETGRDLFQPRQTEDGALWYIRKPHQQSGVVRPTFIGCLRDVALLPFRMARAVFQYFNVFSIMYTGKPLVSGRGALQRRVDPRQLFIHSNIALAGMAQGADEEGETVVPASWELVRRAPSGHIETVAKHVVAYDVAADGSVLYSDGAGITRVSAAGESERVLRAPLIERVLAL